MSRIFEAPRINEAKRREVILRLGHTLILIKNEMAYSAAGISPAKLRRTLRYCITTLKEFQVKTLQLRFANECLDVFPLACLYNLGVQILALREIQNKLNSEVFQWKNEILRLQILTPKGYHDMGKVLAEIHGFLVFATFANKIHPISTLTQFSVASAEKKAGKSLYLKEASHVASILKAAFSIQGALEKSEVLGPKSTYIISDPISLERAAVLVIEKWYTFYESSISDAENETRRQTQLPVIPLACLLTWFVNANRRVLAGSQAIRPALIEAVDKSRITEARIGRDRIVIVGTAVWKIPYGTMVPEFIPRSNGDKEPLTEVPMTTLIEEFLEELGEIPDSLPLDEYTFDQALPEDKSPIFFEFQVSVEAHPELQRIQKLLRFIYRSHNTSAYLRLEVLLRAHWLDMGKKKAFSISAKRRIEYNCLNAAGALIVSQRANKVCFPEQRVPGTFPLVKTSRDPFRSDFLGELFRVFKDLNMAEEEYLAGITGLSVNQVHSWFLHKRRLEYRRGGIIR